MEERDDNAPSGQLALSRARSREAYAGPPKGGCLMAVEDSVAQDQLRAFVERIERMNEEKAAINADVSEIYKEAKGNGFDTKVLKKIIADRAKDASERLEFEAVYELYAAALGMDHATRAPAHEGR
jgi:uncharacterized protein (UPF0335 family)